MTSLEQALDRAVEIVAAGRLDGYSPEAVTTLRKMCRTTADQVCLAKALIEPLKRRGFALATTLHQLCHKPVPETTPEPKFVQGVEITRVPPGSAHKHESIYRQLASNAMPTRKKIREYAIN